MKLKILIGLIIPLTISSCSLMESRDTSHPLNACKMLNENNDWMNHLNNSYKKWGIPASIQLAFIKKESSFIYDAKPLKEEGFFYNDYYSSAYGYSQALDGTWDDYKRNTNNTSANRTSFGDSTDFIGWYLNNFAKKANIKRSDTYNLYLIYHEGFSGYKKKTYNKKSWLKTEARKVKKYKKIYSNQINKCNF
jgi:hypothetical protein